MATKLSIIPVRPSKLVGPFQERVRRCSDVGMLKTTCLRFAVSTGICAVTYHHLPPIGAADPIAFNLICVGFPPELVKRFESNNPIELDESAKQVLRGAFAQWWDASESPGRLTNEQQEWLEFAQSKLGYGIHLPVFGPSGRNGYVSLSLGDSRPEWSDDELLTLQLCCQTAHLQYCHLLRSYLPKQPKLSPREEQILSWVAMGKSNGAIAEILNISESSVITYLERAFQKLGVDSRVSATLRAYSRGQLRQME